MTLYFEKDLTPEQRRTLLQRPANTGTDVLEKVRSVCTDVKKRGDKALFEYSQKFDKATPAVLRVSAKEIANAPEVLTAEQRTALTVAARNIEAFHALQQRPPQHIETMPGVVCRREVRPIESVGLYVPAGSAPLPSTVLMLGIPARIAQCKRIVLCSPPNSRGTVDPYVLAAASLLGLDEIYCVGGAQAIAALAYGTESIPKVDKIFGPGNKYVAAAKQIVSTDPDGAGIDMLAGPSEVLIIADSNAKPDVVAWDCVSQAEHDPDAQAIVVTTDATLAGKVEESLSRIIQSIERKEIIRQSLERGYILVANTIESALAFTNEYAPEHLIINTQNAESHAQHITNAGSVFLGPFSPVTAGDYASGTNHTLPTSGTARWYSGVTVESFQKTITFQTLTRDGLEALAPTLHAFSVLEGLPAHWNAVSCRLSGEKNS